MPVVATAGSNRYGQLGRGGDFSFFKVLDIEGDVVQICCGADYTLAVTNEGNVYGWGRNNSGQLALSEVIVERPTLIKTHIKEPIVKVSCGESHSLFLTSSGKIYSCGEGSCGQRGDGTYHGECFELKRVLLDEYVRDVFCGARTSYAITNDGELFEWGETTTGMLGITSWSSPTLANPTHLSFGSTRTRIARVVASVNFAILITTTGEILGSGSNANGQLGISDKYTHIWRPIRDVGRVSYLACGSRHTLCHQLEKNRCIVLSTQITSFTVPNLEGLAAGDDNNLVWTDAGSKLLVCGYNRHRQLGVGDIPLVEELTEVPLPRKAKVVNVSCGRKHICVLLSEEIVRDENYMVFMEDSFVTAESLAREPYVTLEKKKSLFFWVCLASSAAAFLSGVLIAKYRHRRV
ncbi:Regulator of chromosome condensation [Trypanosoma melophagium]|uniref:Regulator of chromosome condensation n=1 Tax=Trypanosoma melophagium TaxID=715481 RepID=UPI00351A18BD|nr:Regulator of chromosome condensation [Trypanosoma melophagium]